MQVRKVANRLHVPFGVLFLSHPPTETLPIADFRTVAGTEFEEPSTELRDVLMAVLRRKDWLSDYLRESGADRVSIVGSAVRPDSAQALGSQIREYLELSEIAPLSNGADFLRELVRRTEELGVNVARNGVVGNNTHRPLTVGEFRGFSLSDEFAPFIFINGADSPEAQVFTLVHELAHILRGDSGISASGVANVGRVESICNAAAADALVPDVEFERVWDDSLGVDEAIRLAARNFRVSKYVIAIRAFESGKLDRAELDDLFTSYQTQYRSRRKGTGGDFYKTLVTRNGRAFTSRVVGALNQQHVLTRDAATLLDTKVSRLVRLGQEIRGA